MKKNLKKIIISFWVLALLIPSVVWGQLNTSQGGTGRSSFSPNSVVMSGTTATSSLIASSSPTVNYITATSTNATSTFPRLSITTGISLLGEYFENFTTYVRSLFTATAPITVSSGVIACNTASGSQAGCLSSADWTTFNNSIDGSATAGQATYWDGTNSITGESGYTYTAGTNLLTVPNLAVTDSDTESFRVGNSTTGYINLGTAHLVAGSFADGLDVVVPDAGGIRFKTVTDTPFQAFGRTSGFPGQIYFDYGSNSAVNGSLNFRNLSTGATSVLKADNDNQIGINDSTPDYRLDVGGEGRFTSYVDASRFTATTTTATSSFFGDLRFDAEILPDGTTCATGDTIKKTGANDWDCATYTSGTVTGTGVANYVAYWDGTSSITGKNTFLFDPDLNKLSSQEIYANSTLVVANQDTYSANNITTFDHIDITTDKYLRIVTNNGASTNFQFFSPVYTGDTSLAGDAYTDFGGASTGGEVNFRNVSRGTETALQINSHSLVGIGTTAQTAKLHVASTTNTTVDMFKSVNGTAGNQAGTFVHTGMGNTTCAGCVGIGTTSPYAKLSVVGQVVARNYTATGTVASTFPYASTTAFSSSDIRLRDDSGDNLAILNYANGGTPARNYGKLSLLNEENLAESTDIYITEDPLNTAVNATYITPPVSGTRVYIGTPSKPAYALNLANTTIGLEGLPGLITTNAGTSKIAHNNNATAWFGDPSGVSQLVNYYAQTYIGHSLDANPSNLISVADLYYSGPAHQFYSEEQTLPVMGIYGDASQSGNLLNLYNSTPTVLSAFNSSGWLGIGTSSPFSILSIEQASPTATPFFTVASTTGSTRQVVYQIDSKGHQVHGGATPTLTGCGTGATVAGNDNVGRVTLGTGLTGVDADCQINFSKSWTTAPACFSNNETQVLVSRAVGATGSVTISVAAFLTDSNVYTYSCRGY